MQQTAEAQQNLSISISRLYAVFAHYPLRPVIHGCDHCVFPEDQARLRSKPLHALTEQDLGKYLWQAMTTWGDREDFKHFLPRLLELMTAPSEWRGDLWLVMSKLRYGDWQIWPESERESINGYLIAQWRLILASSPTEPFDYTHLTADSFLGNIAYAVADVQSFLEIWRTDNSTNAVVHLGKLLYEQSDDLFAKGQLGGTWDKHPMQSLQIMRWVLSQHAHEFLQRALGAYMLQWMPDELWLRSDQLQQVHATYTHSNGTHP